MSDTINPEHTGKDLFRCDAQTAEHLSVRSVACCRLLSLTAGRSFNRSRGLL